MHYLVGTASTLADTMTPKQFSTLFAMVSARSKWINAVVQHFQKPESKPYSGLYIRWLYPGCPEVRKFKIFKWFKSTNSIF
jgi:hypothetical protein